MNPGRAARVFSTGIGLYQRVSGGSAPRCRYLPTCSQYAREAFETHGAARGGWMALRRLSRCHPWGGHGYNPVPPRSPRTTLAGLTADDADLHGAR